MMTEIRSVEKEMKGGILCAAFLFFVMAAQAQVTLAFQGGEAGDTWGYTSSGASAIAQAEVTSPLNYVSGTASIVAGGNTGGGNCWAGGSGNGPAVARQFTFNSIDISSSNESVRTLTFSWGNRYPMCNGTGWDAGENLSFTAYHDGVAQGAVSLATGNNNAGFQIDNNAYTWSIPACVNDFYCVMSVTTNRSDELLFLDDVKLTAPQLNPTTVQPSPISGATNICGGIETYSVTQVSGAIYTWSGLPAGATFTTPNGTSASNVITVDWGTAPAGTYTLTVTPSNSCVPAPDQGTPQTITVTISNGTTPVTISGPTTICPGATIVLSSSYGSGNVWSPNNETTPTINVTGPGTYTVTITTGCGTVTDSHTVTAAPAPAAAINPSGPVTICTGGNVTLTASGGAFYQWTGGPAIASYNVSTAGIYTVTVTNSCGSDNASVTVTESPLPAAAISPNGTVTICTGDAVTLMASGGDTYQWTSGPATAAYSVSTAGIYTVTVTNSCGSDNASVTVNESPLPNAQISGTLSYCEGSSTILTASGGTSYQWTGGPATSAYSVNTPGTYTVAVTNSCGTDNESVTVTELPLPSAQINGTLSFCEGSSTTLTASGGTTYQWTNGPTTAAITVSAPGTYTVTAINSCGNDLASVTVTQSALPDAQITGATTFCSGSSTTLTASGGASYQWTDGPATAAFTVSAPGTYTVTATNACGNDAASVTVTESVVQAAFTASTLIGNAPVEIAFTNTSLPLTAAFDWDFSDGSGSSAVNPVHTFTSEGSYTVTLNAENADGCTDATSLLITVTGLPAALEVPNVFTPNGDQANDVFAVSAERIAAYHILIYNRWGNTVTESDDVLMEWDGTLNGEPASEGTYFYRIAATGTDGKSYDKTGFFELVR